MMSMLVNNILDGLKNKVDYYEHKDGRIELSFQHKYALQAFVMELRKQGVSYGIELAQLSLGREHEHNRP